MKYFLNILLLLPIALFSSCAGTSDEEIFAYQWKYSDGYYIGDVLHFETEKHENFDYPLQIKDGIISKNNKSIALVVGTRTQINGLVELEVTNLTGKKHGFYVRNGKAFEE